MLVTEEKSGRESSKESMKEEEIILMSKLLV